MGKHDQRALHREAQGRHDRGPTVHVGRADFSAMHVGHVRGPPDHDRHEMNGQKRPIGLRCGPALKLAHCVSRTQAAFSASIFGTKMRFRSLCYETFCGIFAQRFKIICV